MKLVVANNIRWQSAGAFKPYVEIHIVGPYLADKKRKFATASKTNSWKPKFNESFCLDLGNEDEPQNYEIMFQLRDYSLLKENRLVGVGLLQLREIFQFTDASHSGWVQLGKQLQIDEAGMILLRILAQRQNDEIAKEFVKLKLAQREAEPLLRNAYSTQSLLEADRISVASKQANKVSMT